MEGRLDAVVMDDDSTAVRRGLPIRVHLRRRQFLLLVLVHQTRAIVYVQ